MLEIIIAFVVGFILGYVLGNREKKNETYFGDY
jgi:hypothetical protein